jgi:hypothetical protein
MAKICLDIFPPRSGGFRSAKRLTNGPGQVKEILASSWHLDQNRINPYNWSVISVSKALFEKERNIMASNSKQTKSIRGRKLAKSGKVRKRRLRREGTTPSLKKLLDGESTPAASS